MIIVIQLPNWLMPLTECSAQRTMVIRGCILHQLKAPHTLKSLSNYYLYKWYTNFIHIFAQNDVEPRFIKWNFESCVLKVFEVFGILRFWRVVYLIFWPNFHNIDLAIVAKSVQVLKLKFILIAFSCFVDPIFNLYVISDPHHVDSGHCRTYKSFLFGFLFICHFEPSYSKSIRSILI